MGAILMSEVWGMNIARSHLKMSFRSVPIWWLRVEKKLSLETP